MLVYTGLPGMKGEKGLPGPAGPRVCRCIHNKMMRFLSFRRAKHSHWFTCMN